MNANTGELYDLTKPEEVEAMRLAVAAGDPVVPVDGEAAERVRGLQAQLRREIDAEVDRALKARPR